MIPIFIPSKGRAEKRLTADYLDYCKIPYRIVIEPSQYCTYLKEVKDKKKLLVMDMSYKGSYETCDNKGDSLGTGAGAVRNFLWDYSISEGHNYHWTMDDNIRAFYRLNRNLKVRVTDRSIFSALEDFAQR